jgi:phosphoribosyl-dephospho-CoA transferase
LAASVAADGIALQGQFPSLHDVAQSSPWGVGAAAWLAQGQALKAEVRVYGSYGWQFLTGMPYVRAGSDLDLSVHAPDLHAALQALDWLAQTVPLGEAGSGGRAPSARLPLRVDGGIVFPWGQALAWREFQQLRQGTVAQALVKDRHSLRLLDWPALVALAQAPTQTSAPGVSGAAVA